jgi:hypothetical protein
MKHAALSICCSGALLVAGCATPASSPVPANLVPAGERSVDRIASRGVAVYECRAKAGDPAGAAWVYVSAEADLIDANGRKIGRHAFPPPLWESDDGSRIAGEIKARADAPSPGAVPWLLVATRSTGGEGRLSKATSLQRVNTAGGAAPAAGCNTTSLGSKERVSFTADYVLFTK